MRLMCAAVLGALVLASPASAAGTAADFGAAFALAQKLAPGGKLIKARVEGTPPADVFGFYFLLKGEIVEIEISRGGVVLKNKTSNKDIVSKDVLRLLGQASGPAKMPAGRILEIAGDSLKGTPFDGLQYDTDGGRLVVRVGDVVLDAATGEVVSK